MPTRARNKLKDLGDKIPADKKQPIEDAIAKVREALKGEDVDAIKSAYDDLQNKFQGVTEELYKQAAANAQAAGAGPGPQAGGSHPGTQAGAQSDQGKGDVVDAEFEVVDDETRNKPATSHPFTVRSERRSKIGAPFAPGVEQQQTNPNTEKNKTWQSMSNLSQIACS